MMQRLRVLVTGATGRLGGAAARTLIERGHHVRALTRDPRAPEAQRLAHSGAEVVQGDLEHASSVRAAAQDLDAAFLVTPAVGAEDELRLGTNALLALAEASVGHVVLASVASADRDTGIPQFDAKAQLEGVLETCPVEQTVVAPAFFRENLTAPHWRDGLQQGTLAMALPPNVPLQNVEVDEVARFVALVLEEPDEHAGRRIELASDRTTPRRMAQVLSEATGRTIDYREIPHKALAAQDPAYARMFRWLATTGHAVDIRALRRAEPDVEWRSFRQWAAQQPWERLLDTHP